jgi:hypothetical protein
MGSVVGGYLLLHHNLVIAVPAIVGLQYLILPILDKPNMGLFWVVVYWRVI